MNMLHNASSITLSSLFKNSILSLMEKHIPTKLIKEDHTKKPWINSTLKKAMRRSKLYTRMKKTGKASNINQYKKDKYIIPKESPTRQNLKCCRLCLIEPVHGRYWKVQITVIEPVHGRYWKVQITVKT
jgi:hypothetical protein